MRLTAIALVLCACAWVCAGDGAHLKGKVRVLARLAGKHKRGVLSSVPPFKLGHDIPLVTHSVVKPLLVTYPPTAAVTAVKVPLAHPLLPRYPVGVGHRVPHLPHPHYGLKFPHHKGVVLPKPDHHYHHHHHHVAPRPVVPVVPATPLPVAAPAIAQPVPVPSPPVLVPQPSPLPPPAHLLPPNHLHLRPLLPAAPVLAAAPAPVVAPAFSSFAPQFPYILRAGGAIQSSLFASYPRYPFSNYPAPLIPLGATSFSQLVPHQYAVPPPGPPDGVVVGQPALHAEPTPAVLHAHGEVPHGVHLEPAQPTVHEIHLGPTQPSVHLHQAHPELHYHPEQQHELHLQPGQPGIQLHSAQPELHFQPGVHVHQQPDIHLQPQPAFNVQPQPEYHLQPGHTDVHLQPQPDFHYQGGHTDVHLQPQPDYHFQGGHTDVHLQPQPQPDYHFQGGQTDVHLQPQPDYHFQGGQPDLNVQPQPDYHLQPQPDYSGQAGGVVHPTQTTVDSNGWSPVPAAPSDAGHGEHYGGDGPQQFPQEHGFDQQFHDYQNQLHHHIQQLEHNLQHGQGGAEYPGDYSGHQPAAEYGAPGGGAEGRSDAEPEADAQRFHNHIPLGLQPPLDRPLDHFR